MFPIGGRRGFALRRVTEVQGKVGEAELYFSSSSDLVVIYDASRVHAQREL